MDFKSVRQIVYDFVDLIGSRKAIIELLRRTHCPEILGVEPDPFAFFEANVAAATVVNLSVLFVGVGKGFVHCFMKLVEVFGEAGCPGDRFVVGGRRWLI